MIKLFEKTDLAKIKDPIEAIIAEGDLDVFDNGVGLTFEEDGVVLGCGGVVLHGSDVGEFWARISKKTSAIVAVSSLRAAMTILKNSFPGVTFICRVKDGWTKGERLARHLGFVRDHIEDDYGVYKWQIQ